MTTQRRGAAFVAVLSAGALALTACGGGSSDTDSDDEGSGDGGTQSGTITVASDTEFTSYNGNSETGNGTWNQFVLNGVLLNFWEYAPEGGAVPFEEYGTYEKTSDDPLTVEYKINEDAVWSDGDPIDCDDFLLDWASSSGYYKTDEVGEDGQPVPLFTAPSSVSYGLVEKPDCEPGAKDFTLVYTEPYADWKLTTSSFLPAHVAAEQGGLTPEEFVAAIKADDQAALAPVAEFWNSGWDMASGQLLDPALIPSSGPYVIDSWDAGQSMTLKANENYWGTPPKTETIVIRFIAQDQQVQALANGEVDVISPQASPDLKASLDGLGDQVEVIEGDLLTWEHLDFNQNAGEVFADPNLREAFAKCVPRQQIIDNLIKPANSEAVVMDLREIFPWDESYETVRDAAVGDKYDEVDIEGAKALVDAAGAAGTEIHIARSETNQRRADTVALIKSSCDQAGFNIVDTPAPDMGQVLGNPAGNQVLLYAWAGSGNLTSGASLYKTGEGQNPFGYSNPAVDAAWDELVVTLDEDRQLDLLTEIETNLWSDLFSIPLYAHPGITAHAPGIEGVVNNAAQTQVSFNMDEWSRSS